MSTAIVMLSGLAVFQLYAEEGDLGIGTGYFTIGLSLGELSGGVIGGLVYSRGGHYALFAVAASVVAADFILRLILRYPDHAKSSDEAEVSDEPVETDRLVTPGQRDDALGGQETSSWNTPGSFAHFVFQKEYLASVMLMAVAGTIRTAFESVSALEHFGLVCIDRQSESCYLH